MQFNLYLYRHCDSFVLEGPLNLGHLLRLVCVCVCVYVIFLGTNMAWLYFFMTSVTLHLLMFCSVSQKKCQRPECWPKTRPKWSCKCYFFLFGIQSQSVCGWQFPFFKPTVGALVTNCSLQRWNAPLCNNIRGEKNMTWLAPLDFTWQCKIEVNIMELE